MSSNPLVNTPKNSPIFGLASKYQIEPAKLVEVLRGTVIKPDKNGKTATNEEVAAFCIVAQHYGLNPFLREIHAFASGDKGIVPIVGIDGWAHIVNQSPGFNGCVFEEVEDEQGKPVKITCHMHIKDRTHPISATERYSECKRPTMPWNTMPWRMLRHKAYMQAARIAFGLSGIYDEDEARDIVKPMAATAAPNGTDPLALEEKIKANGKKQETKKDVAPVADVQDAIVEDAGELSEGEVPNNDGCSDKPEVAAPDTFAIGELRGLAVTKACTEKEIAGWFQRDRIEDMDANEVEKAIADLRLKPDVTVKQKAKK